MAGKWVVRVHITNPEHFENALQSCYAFLMEKWKLEHAEMTMRNNQDQNQKK